MNESKISPFDEQRLVGAIEKAATLASINEDQDRSQILADCLLDDNIDGRFAKVASDAFNRRLTVLKFQKTADEHRGEPFALANATDVMGFMGIPSMEKAASFGDGGFVMSVEDNGDGFVKVAAAELPAVSYVPLEARVTTDILKRKLDSALTKQAAAFSDGLRKVRNMEANIQKRKKYVAGELKKCASFMFRTLCNVHGPALGRLMRDELPDMDFSKTASAVDPGTPLSREIASLINDNEQYVKANNDLVDYQTELTAMCKAASDLGEQLDKRGAASLSFVQPFINATAMTGATALRTVPRMYNEISSDVAGASEQIRDMYYKGRDVGMHPATILDAELLNRDRFRDRMLAMSDMLADPELAAADPREVSKITLDLMNNTKALEQPGNRGVLKTYVNQILSQGGRLSTADQAALAQTGDALLKEINSGVATRSLESVRSMDKSDAPDGLTGDSIFKRMGPLSLYSNKADYASRYQASLDAERKSKDWANEDKENEEKAEKARRDALTEKAKKDEQTRKDTEQEIEERFKKAIKLYQLEPVIGKDGKANGNWRQKAGAKGNLLGQGELSPLDVLQLNIPQGYTIPGKKGKNTP